jgi:hypothetical protein
MSDREAFEKWFLDAQGYDPFSKRLNQESEERAMTAWEGWQAALQHSGEPVAVVEKGVLNWIDGKQFDRDADLYTHPQPAVPEGYNELLIEYIRDDLECIKDGYGWCFIDPEGQADRLKYLRDQGLLIQHPTDPERVKVKALLSAGKENNTHKHTVAILTEKWDEKTVTSAPFCIVCGESLSAAKENNNE